MLESELVRYALVGALGGVIRDILATGGLVLPHRQKMADGAMLLRLGFILSAAIGAVVGCAVDHNWMTAFAMAYAGPDALERAVNVKAMVQRRNGRNNATGA